MSGFSNVDASGGVDHLVSYLNATDAGLAAMKAYVAVAARRAVPDGVVLDLGCGVGHDLVRLDRAGVRPVGIDASAEMLARARRTAGGVPLVRADAGRIPFGDASLDGCRAERILQHVEEPGLVVAELARVLRSGGFLAVFEPDYSTFRVDSDDPDDASIPARLMRVRHPRIGADTAGMLESHGFAIDDIVTESSRGYSLDGRLLPVDVVSVVGRAVDDGRLDAGHARRWISEQQRRAATATFRAAWDKILVLGHRRG